MGAMPPHIEPLHWIRAPAWDPLEKSAGRGCAVTVSGTVRVVPFAEAVIPGEKASPLEGRYWPFVATVKVADVCPAAMVMRGSVAASSTSELASVTTVPVAGAAALSVTVHVTDPPLPPAIDDGLHDSALIPCAYALD